MTCRTVSKVLIVDDHPAVREGLAARIAYQPDLEVCGEAEDVAQALEVAEATDPDVVVIDISLRASCGIDLVKQLKVRRPQSRLLVCSMYPSTPFAERALRAGAEGYINKKNTTGRILDAIRCVRDGQIYRDDEAGDDPRSNSEPAADPPAPPLPPRSRSAADELSDRELEVFRRIGEGQKTSEIAAALSVSVHTVETYRKRIKRKLGLQTSAQLSSTAARWVPRGRAE